MKLFKTFISLVVLFLVVGFTAISSLYLFVNPNHLKPLISEAFFKNTGYELNIIGPLAFTFYPNFALVAKKAIIHLPNHPDELISLDEPRLGMKLSDAWKHQKNWQGTIDSPKAKILSIFVQDLHATIHWENEKFSLDPLTASLYEGNFKGLVTGTSLRQLPQFELQGQLSNINLKSLLADLHSVLILSGKADIRCHAKTFGHTEIELFTNLVTNTEFNILQGTVAGIDLNYLIGTAQSLFSLEAGSLNNSHQTAFDHLKGTFTLQNGIAYSKDLFLSTAIFTVNGAGSLVLLTQGINLNLLIDLDPLHSRGTGSQPVNKTWQVPITISGSISNPEIHLTLNDQQKENVQEEVEKIKEKARVVIKKHVHGELGNILQKLVK